MATDVIYNTLMRMAKRYARRSKQRPEEILSILYILGASSIERWSPDKGCTLQKWLDTPNFRKRVWKHIFVTPRPILVLQPLEGSSQPETGELAAGLMLGLTETEREVCGLLARGVMQKDIAKALGVSRQRICQIVTGIRQYKEGWYGQNHK